MQIMGLDNKCVVLLCMNNFQMNIALVFVDRESCSGLDSSSINSAVSLISFFFLINLKKKNFLNFRETVSLISWKLIIAQDHNFFFLIRKTTQILTGLCNWFWTSFFEVGVSRPKNSFIQQRCQQFYVIRS